MNAAQLHARWDDVARRSHTAVSSAALHGGDQVEHQTGVTAEVEPTSSGISGCSSQTQASFQSNAFSFILCALAVL